VNPLPLPVRSPNLNSYAERWVRSVKEECVAKLILVRASSLRRALQQYLLHYHEERNHQGKENRILFPFQTKARRKEGAVQCRERLRGLLKYYVTPQPLHLRDLKNVEKASISSVFEVDC